MGSIDKIEYDKRYPEIVAECEKEHNCLVYHAIESGNMLSLLFVNPKDKNRLIGNRIVAYVYNLNVPGMHECGDIWLTSLHGALVRTDY